MADFAQTLAKMAGGTLLPTLNDRLTEVAEAVHAHNKVGTLTLKLKLSPNGENGVTVEEDISSKVPQPNRGKALFFIDDSGNLLRNDPRQGELQLRPVGGNGAIAEATQEEAATA